MAYDFNEIIRNFNINYKAEPYGNGHINDTFLCDCNPKYIIQKINTSIFSNPEEVMDNISAVTEHLKKKIIKNGGDPDRETLQIVKTIDNKNVYRTESGDYFRAYKYVDKSVTKEAAQTPEDLYNAAKAFGKFQNMLSDFPADTLHETIPDFHNTKKRFSDFVHAVDSDLANRRKTAEKEIDFALARKDITGVIVDLMEKDEIPLRVTHNDTKLNNVLFDEDGKKAICVIDLDTVMPGSLLYDYGDALRFGASSAAEDEKDLSSVYFDLDKFEAFTKGFLEELKSSITPKEAEFMPFAAKLLTYECGIRFLGDYLNGDSYFKIHYPGQNLDRARTQLKLVWDIENKTDEMTDIIKRLMK